MHHIIAERLLDSISILIRLLLMKLCVIAICIFFSSTLASAELRESSDQSKYCIAIHCSSKVLQLWRGAELMKEYPVEIGKGGIGKQSGGDHRTPIGNYAISWMASRQLNKGHKIIEHKSWCIGNKFTYASSGPALEKLWSEAYGGDEAVVISINYPNENDRKKGYTGECIHIHADKRHDNGILRKSYGCIHMFPADAKDLYEYVSEGTTVMIFP